MYAKTEKAVGTVPRYLLVTFQIENIIDLSASLPSFEGRQV